jgi:hypothetical protein
MCLLSCTECPFFGRIRGVLDTDSGNWGLFLGKSSNVLVFGDKILVHKRNVVVRVRWCY